MDGEKCGALTGAELWTNMCFLFLEGRPPPCSDVYHSRRGFQELNTVRLRSYEKMCVKMNIKQPRDRALTVWLRTEDNGPFSHHTEVTIQENPSEVSHETKRETLKLQTYCCH